MKRWEKYSGGVLEVACDRGVRGLGTEYRRQDVAAEQWEGSAGEVSGGRMLGWSTRGGVLEM
ncbi:hypothetical protein [Bartonella rattaustraliani]|uniref:hypothetical protein n=1 Tax=Bartonella rattaustraliani TaxID=481139 RepID=UPI001FCA56CE|nr:hypothetical protein [Bartonella rattaustraliani]